MSNSMFKWNKSFWRRILFLGCPAFVKQLQQPLRHTISLKTPSSAHAYTLLFWHTCVTLRTEFNILNFRSRYRALPKSLAANIILRGKGYRVKQNKHVSRAGLSLPSHLCFLMHRGFVNNVGILPGPILRGILNRPENLKCLPI